MVGLVAAGCSPSAQPTPAQTAQPSADGTATGTTPPVTTTTAPATIPVEPRAIPVNVQGVAPVGVTLRVKNVELGTDATVLDVSASYGGTMTNNVELAGSPTYLLNEQGEKLMLKPPQDNRNLNIVRGETMDGKLVFLGAIAPGTKSVKLVVNDGNDGNSIIAPGLTIAIPLDGPAK
jgi:hypothetical protein